MTIDEAIKKLEIRIENASLWSASANVDDIQLGVEALRHIQRQRKYNLAFSDELLPSEIREQLRRMNHG